MTGYLIAPAARQDLFDIVDYIAAENAPAAHRVRDALFDAFDRLASRPGIGHTRTDLTTQDVRFWTVMGRYSIVYRASEPFIEIVRVLGPGRDATRLLK